MLTYSPNTLSNTSATEESVLDKMQALQEISIYFSLSSPPELLSRFLVFETRLSSDTRSSLHLGLSRLLESFWIQLRVWEVLKEANYSKDIMHGYLCILDLVNPNDSRACQIQRDIWSWFENETDPITALALKIVFKEEEMISSIGTILPFFEEKKFKIFLEIFKKIF